MAKSIGVALIARNAGETLGACLESVRPYVQQIVVGVDETTTDNTTEIAAAHADLVETIAVSEKHVCDRHGEILAQHFAKARNKVFSLLDPQLDVLFWIDADDIVKKADLLPGLAEEIYNSPAVGAWLPYHYSTTQEGALTTTKFHRERLLRTKDAADTLIKWTWHHRVHENITPELPFAPTWLVKEDPGIFHQERGHDTRSSCLRNITLLEIDLEKNPKDSRAIFYLGNSYFALGNMEAAISYYEQLGAIGKSEYELWQTWCYCSLAYERLGNLDAATGAAFRAIDINPKHPEPYYRLAAIALLAGKYDQCEFWTKQASTTDAAPPKELPPFFVFKNPMDYHFNNQMPLADALHAQGKVKQAREVLEQANVGVDDPRVIERIGQFQKLEAGQDVANSFLRLMHEKDDETVVKFWEEMDFSGDIKQFGRIRNRVMPAYLKNRRGVTPRIIFYCGRSFEEWSPLSLTTTGIGGSETAAIEIAKRFSADGWKVDVYNSAGRNEGVYGDVGYWDLDRITRKDECDVFVSWRFPAAYKLGLKSGKAILWCHDLHYGPQARPEMLGWEASENAVVCGVSKWHANYLRDQYSLTRTDFLPNGINLDLFPHFQTKERPEKKPFQCVYTSSADRGLERLLALWPRILEQEPGATLQIAYGWDTIDRMIQSGRPHLQALKDKVMQLATATPEIEKSITWRGRLSKPDLAQLLIESSAWTYPTSFLEVSCISAMEAMAAGTTPVTSYAGALPETIKDGGFLIPGLPETRSWQDLWLHTLLGSLSSPQVRWPLMAKGMQRVQDLTWDAAYLKWLQVIDGLGTRQEQPIAELAGGAE